MRLDPQHITAIKRLAAEQFGAGAQVRLFGSRVDDAARGGRVVQSCQSTDAGAMGRCRDACPQPHAPADP